MVARRVPWSEVQPYSIVQAANGETAVVLRPWHPHVITLDIGTFQRPASGDATVLEPELPDAVVNLMAHFTLDSP